MWIWTAMTLAATPGEEANRRMELTGPHVAYYIKESTREPVLEIHYRGPGDATARAINQDGAYLVSVDPSHMRVRVDAETCASVDARALLGEAKLLAQGQALDDHTPRLNYRAGAAEMVDISAAYVGRPSPILFSWHADLDDPEVTVSADKAGWQAELAGSSWTVSRKTGLLQRMTVGPDALVLERVESGKKATPLAASETCVATTSGPLEQQMATQFRLFTFVAPYGALSKGWSGMEPAVQEKAVADLEAWWKSFFSAELAAWVSSRVDETWQNEVTKAVADPVAFGVFKVALAPQQKDQALHLWKQHWFQKLADGMLNVHVTEILAFLDDGLKAEDALRDDAISQKLFYQPLQAGLLSEAEGALLGPLAPVLETAAASLEKALAEP